MLAALNIRSLSAHERLRHEVRTEIARQVEDASCHTAIVSDEHLSVHADTPTALARVAQFLRVDPAQVVPVIYFRRQDRLLESMMSEALKALQTRVYDFDAPGANVALRAIRFDYMKIIDNLSEAFGGGNIRARAFGASNPDILDCFAETTGIPLVNPGARTRENPSLPQRIMAPLWNLSRRVSPGDTPALQAEWREFTEKLAQRFPGRSYRLDDINARIFMERFRRVNDWMAGRFPDLNAMRNEDRAVQDAGVPVSLDEILGVAPAMLSPSAFRELRGLAAAAQGDRPDAGDRPAVGEGDDSAWQARCPVCGAAYRLERAAARREGRQCPGCGASARASGLMLAISEHVHGPGRILPAEPPARHVRVIGLSDGPVYRGLLADKFDYANTFYHKEPRLDITDPDPAIHGTADILISSEVMEHVVGDVSKGFRGMFDVLGPGGLLVFTVPYVMAGEGVEHYPGAVGYEVVETDGGTATVRVEYSDGRIVEDLDPRFHGGPGSTLEMRVFSLDRVLRELRGAGFADIRVHDENRPEFGVVWQGPSRIITARKPGARGASGNPA